MKSTATYGMTNVSIEKEQHNGVTYWTVYADTERFGNHEIMAQCISKTEAEKWCEANGVASDKSAAEIRLDEEISKRSFGKVQIGNVMYRNLYIEDGHIYGHSNGYWGWRDITTMIKNCKMVSGDIGKTKEYSYGYDRMENRTVKFGKACTW